MKKLCCIRINQRPIWAFLLTAGLLSGVFMVFGLFPFGKNTLAWGDLSQQVVPLMMELKDILEGKAGMLLNLQNAGGMSFWGVFFFFLSSPFSFLVAFVEKGQIYLLVNLLVLAKLSLAAASASCFFGKESPRLTLPAHLSLCIAYGMSGYGLLYYQNLVWLDMAALFPVIMLGFMRVIERKSAKLLTSTLLVALVVNYYLSYMVFLGMILFATVFITGCAERSERRELAGKIGLSALTALLLAAVVWLPSLLQCLSSARTGGELMESVRSGGFWGRLTTTLPVLFCTAAASALPVLWRRFAQSPKSKAIAICWALTVLPLMVEPVNKLWHMGSYQAFPARYGYMPVFFGLWFLAVGLDAPEKETPQKRKALSMLFVLAAVAGAVFLLGRHFEDISAYTSSLWVSEKAFGLLCLLWAPCAAAAAVACRAAARNKASRRFTGWVLLGVCIIQSVVQAAAFVGSAAHDPGYKQSVVEAAPPEDTGVYRVKTKEKYFDVNLLGAAGYPTLNHYTSLTDSSFLAAMKKLGYSSYWLETSGSGGTAISDILLSNKYVLDHNLRWTHTGSGDIGCLLPLGALPESMEIGDRFQLQEQIYQSVTKDKKGAFIWYKPAERGYAENSGKIQVEPGELRYEISVGEAETLYFDAFSCISTRLREKINDCFHIKVNGQVVAGSYPTQRCNGILELGRFEQETVVVEVGVKSQAELRSFGVCGLRASAAQRFARTLSNAGVHYAQDQLLAQPSAASGQALFLSIPWSRGMTVWVDGVATPFRTVLDCFIEVPLPKGNSKVSLTYIPGGLAEGAFISGITLAILLLGRLILHRLGRKAERLRNAWYSAAPLLLTAAFSAVVLLVYVLPPVLWVFG